MAEPLAGPVSPGPDPTVPDPDVPGPVLRVPFPDGRRLGAHLPLAKGMVRAAERAHAIGAAALQVFSDNPTAWRRREQPSAELDAFRARLAELDIRPLSIHASYLINLAGPDPEFHERSVEVLTSELRAADTFGAELVNVHVGSHRATGEAAGRRRVAETIIRAFDAAAPSPARARLALENSAGGGWGLGTTIDELAGILDAIAEARGPVDRIAFCLDTAHLWGAGHRVDVPAAFDAVLAAFHARIGLERLALIHLNDSRSALGSRTDRHQHLGAGEIGAAGLRHVLCHPALDRVTYILETPGMDEGYDAVNVARARDLALGRPLATLPPEALDLRGGRARAHGDEPGRG